MKEQSKEMFTPGPWSVTAADDYVIEAVSYPMEFHGRFKGDDLGIWLALVGNRPEDQGEANAHLIAAAPDLYAVLKDFVSITEGSGAVKMKAIAALKKAVGK